MISTTKKGHVFIRLLMSETAENLQQVPNMHLGLNKHIHFLSVFLLALVVGLSPVSSAFAQRSLPLVRDAEIEALIRDYTIPVFRAAGMNSKSVEVFLLNRTEFNAFVTGTRMFMNTGVIMQADTPNEVIGVFAHETGHIVGGHLTRLRDQLEKAKILSVLGLLAGAGAAVAGSPTAGAAIATGSGSALQRGVLAYQRGEEIAADRTAVTLLDKSRQSSKGMLTTFKRLGQNPLFSSGRLDPYALSHPLPSERVALLEQVVKQSPFYNATDPQDLQFRHDLARAKIAAYSGGASLVRSMLGKKLNTPAGTYGIAISQYLQGSSKNGLKMMDDLLKKYPSNPYFHEMRGEMLLRAGNAADAAVAFQKAVSLDKNNSGLLRIQLGHAIIETGDSSRLNEAIKTLKAGIGRDAYSARGYAYLARAYAASGDQVLAVAATAEEKFLQGQIKDAKQFAARAINNLKRGSPEWLRLQDILDFKG